MKRLFYLFMIVIFSVSCNNSEKGKPPQFPADSLFILAPPVISSDTVTLNKKSYYNWYIVAKKIAAWRYVIHTTIGQHLYVLEQMKKIPNFENYTENVWQKKINITIDSVNYQISLFGSYQPDSSVLWQLIADDGQKNRRVLMEADVNKGNTAGEISFNLFEYPNDAFINITWLKKENKLIKNYYVVTSESFYSKSYIELVYLDTLLNVETLNSRTQNKTNIQLYILSKKGKVKSLRDFTDTLWHCWNENLQNCECQP